MKRYIIQMLRSATVIAALLQHNVSVSAETLPAVVQRILQQASDGKFDDDYPTAINKVLPYAEAGNGDAQAFLCQAYAVDKQIQDFKKAKSWCDKSVAQNNAWGQRRLGYLYYEGLGVEQDYKQAKHWYEQAAAQGNAAAQRNLGQMYFRGVGVTQDYGKAKDWYEKAAAQNDSAAQTNLGYLYLEGLGVEQDYIQAKYWYEKAALQHNEAAQKGLARLYQHGLGVKQDNEQADYWYRKSNERTVTEIAESPRYHE